MSSDASHQPSAADTPYPARERLWLRLVVALALFAVALVPRLLDLDVFVTWDEPQWVFRSASFLSALRDGRWSDTVQTGHPGVLTMWAGLPGIVQHSAAQPQEGVALTELVAAKESHVQDIVALRLLGGFLPATRVTVAVLTSLTIAAFYWLAHRLFGLRIALLAALLLALDPFFLAHSRFLHLDALATSFMTVSLLGLLAYLVDGQRLRDALLSGACAGWAVLTKSPAGFLAPFTLLLLFGAAATRFVHQRRAAPSTGRSPIAKFLRAALLWGGAAALVMVGTWPALWADPLRAIKTVAGVAEHHTATAHVNNFWFGRVVRDPGLPFYLLTLAYRLTPVTALGAIAALPLLKRRGQMRLLLVSLLSYVALFILMMSIGAKKFDRYLLPCFPAIDLLAAIGLVALLERLSSWRRFGPRAGRALLAGGMGLAVLAQAWGTLPHHPYYLTYYNPLLGGARQAVRTITVGWGEGMDQAADYLNQKPNSAELDVAAWGVAGLASKLRGDTQVLDESSAVLADYVVLNVSDVQFGSPFTFDYYGSVEPEHTVRLAGVEYAWVYRNDRYRAVLLQLEQLMGSGEPVVFAGQSRVSEEWPPERPSLVLEPDGDEAQAAAQLNQAAVSGGAIWHVALQDAAQEGDVARRLLETHALRLGEQTLGPLAATRYEVPPGASFRAVSVESLAPVTFAGRLSLVGYGLSSEQLRPSQRLDVALRWQAEGSMSEDYTAFVHLLDSGQRRFAQHDELLRDSAGQTTSAWSAGESHDMRFLLDVPSDVPAGEYVLVVGLYGADGSDRLWLDNFQGMQNNTAYPLATLRIEATPAALPQ